jgi:hypothetical protein
LPASAPTKVFTPGSPATLSVTVAGLSSRLHEECTVESVTECWGVTYARVRFADGFTKELPAVYLSPVKAPCKPRRGVLSLKPDADARSEKMKQAEAISWLKDRGYVVLVAGQFKQRMRCTACSVWQWASGGYGNSKGLPDVWVSHPRWGKRVWTPLEYKQDEKSERKPEQVALVESGLSVFVWSLSMALQAVYEVEVSLGVEPHPELVGWLTRHGLLEGKKSE